jgi:hypothetical protein
MTKQITPLRQRMLDDMALRNMSPATQRGYINAVKNFSEPGKPFKPNRKRYYVGVTVRNRSVSGTLWRLVQKIAGRPFGQRRCFGHRFWTKIAHAAHPRLSPRLDHRPDH